MAETIRVETRNGYAGTLFYNEREGGWHWSCYRGHANDEPIEGSEAEAASALEFHVDEGPCKNTPASTVQR